MDLTEIIFNAGVVGAGGAGFPTHVKAKSRVEFVLANGAECEPLIHKDYELMINYTKDIINGMALMIKGTQAKKGYFGIKTKNTIAVDAINDHIGDNKIEICLLGDFYPSGDEYELVYAATKRVIPPYGIPLDIGCVVNNVETLYNVSKAESGVPVTEKFLCVTGMVNNPSSFFVPIGTSFTDVLNHAGGVSVKEFGVFVSGILMGRLTYDLNEVVTKTTAGLIVLPADHYLISRMNRSINDMNRIGKSACDQCSYCTELCPRYLLGYDVQPHKVMRSLGFTASDKEYWNNYAALCCSCGLCSIYSCPEDLYPREACDQSKIVMNKLSEKYKQQKSVQIHPIKEGRRVPLVQLKKKLDLERFETDTPFIKDKPKPKMVKINLKQHMGASAKPIVIKGQVVDKGDVIGKIDDGELGAPVHASISGEVVNITEQFITLSS